MTDKHCILIAAAPEPDLTYVRALLTQKKDAFVVCADGGLRYADELGVMPNLIVGDFDSGNAPLRGSAEVIRLVPEKDDSDLMCAMKLMLSRGYRSFDLVCASGGRIDHFLSNLSLIEYVFEHGGKCTLRDSKNIVFFHDGGKQLYKRNPDYKYVSFIPLDKVLTGVTLTGLKYPLDNVVLNRSAVISISNEPIADEFSIEIKFGRALVIFAKD